VLKKTSTPKLHSKFPVITALGFKIHMIFDFLLDEISVSFEVPRAVLRELKYNAEIKTNFVEPEKSVSLQSVLAWQNWSTFDSKKNNLDCRNISVNYRNYIDEMIEKHDFSKFVIRQDIKNWKCDIRNIHGLSSSKADLRRYSTLNEFALKGTYNFLENISEDNLNKILKYHEIRIINSSHSNDHFVWHQWDGRYFLANDGGSHHFAAAHYIANEINKEVILTGNLEKYSFDTELIFELTNDFEVFFISDRFKELYNSLNKDGVMFCSHWLPSQLGNHSMFLLPKNQKKSVKVAVMMTKMGFFNLGKYLYKISLK